MPSRELLQKSHVALKEQLDVVNPVFQHGDALHAHTEGEAAYVRGIIAVVLHELENVRVNHAAAQDFDPSAHLAQAATAAATLEATNLHVGAGLGEGKERRIEARLHAGAEE